MMLTGPEGAVRQQGSGAQPHDGEIDILAILRILRRNIVLIGFITVAGAVIAVAATMFMTPLYSATAVVRVDPSKPSTPIGAESANTPRSSQAENAVVEGDVAMLESPALLYRVAEDLKLSEDPEFADASSLVSRLKGVVRSAFSPPEPDAESSPSDPNLKASRALANNIEAQRVGLTYLIELTAWSRDPAKAARIANSTLDAYLASEVEAEQETLQRVNGMLTEHIADLRGKVQDSEQAFQRYKAEVGLFDPGGSTLNDQQMASLNEELVAAQGRAAEARAKYEQLRDVTPEELQSAAASPEILASELIANLRTSYADVSRRAAEQNSRYGPNHPSAEAAQAELASVSSQIEAELERIRTGAAAEYEMAKARQDSIAASLEEVKVSGSALDSEMARLNELQREAEANRELYQSVLQRAKETAAAHDLQLSGIQVVSAATVPGAPSAPQRTLIVALGIVGSLALAISIAFGREFMNTGLRGAEDLRENFGIYPLASVPLVGSSTAISDAGDPAWLRSMHRTVPARMRELAAPASAHDISEAVLARPESPFAESIRSLRYSLKRYAEIGHEMRVVMVTSALPGEGKSTVATSLAREAAAAGERVLLIDGDLRRPDLAKTLGLSSGPGLAGLLTGVTDIASLIQLDGRSGVSVIAGSDGVPGPRALNMLSSDRMAELLQIARRNFDLVVIDTAPLVPIADPRVLVDRVDGVVMVVASDHTSREAVLAALHETPGLNERLVGMVLNRMSDAADRYGYGTYASASAG